MRAFFTSLFALVLPLASGSAQMASELVPAGTINEVFSGGDLLLVVEEDPAILRYATRMRDLIPALRGAKIMKSKEAASADLGRRTLIVYGTMQGNAWLAKYAKKLPFEFVPGRGLKLDRGYAGTRMRLACCVRNPQGAGRNVLIYAADRKEDVVGIQDMFHGPSHWVVADANRVLNAGEFHTRGPLDKVAMGRDLEYLAAKIRSVHPSTRTGLSDETERALEAARRAITEKTTPREFGSLVSRVLVSLHDAHSSIRPSDTGPRVDLPIRWLEDGIVVTHDTAVLRRGDLVKRLGGHSEAELFTRLRGMLPAENDQWIRFGGQQLLPSLAMLAAVGATRNTAVEVVVDRTGTEKEFTIRAGDIRSRVTPPKKWARWHVDEKHSLGVFVLDKCIDDDFYRKTLRAFFAAVRGKKVERIAIDVRANGGGNSAVVNEFIRYLDVDEYKSFSGEVRISMDAKARRGLRQKVGYYTDPPKMVANQRHLTPFAGRVFVLTSKHTFSSGNWFAVIFQDNEIGEVVGEATGNAPSSYGDVLEFTLPTSGVRFYLSFKKWLRPDPTRDPASALVPDTVIRLGREHILKGIDPVMAHLTR